MNKRANVFIDYYNSKEGLSNELSLTTFLSYDWSPELVVEYCNLCEILRAALIVENNKSYSSNSNFAKYITEYAQNVTTRLFTWLEKTLETEITPSRNYAFLWGCAFIRPYHYGVPTVGPIQFLQMSPDHFRDIVSLDIGYILIDNRVPEIEFSDELPLPPDELTYSDINKKLSELEDQKWDLELSEPMLEQLYDNLSQCTYHARKWQIWQASVNEIDNEIETYEHYLKIVPKPFNLYEDVLYVYKGKIKCIANHHNLINTTATLLTHDERTIRMNIQWCSDCKRFLIMYDEYIYYRDLFGAVLGNIEYQPSDSDDDFFDMNEYSLLSLCGYNVRQSSNYTSKQRHYILKQLVDLGFMRKDEIIQKLHQFININGTQSRNAKAVSKWKEDLEFIRNYKLDSQAQVRIESIKKYKK